VPFVAEKTTSGVSMKLELKVASTVTKSPALAEPGVIELNTIGTRMVAVELPNFVAFWVLVAAMVTLAGFGTVAGALYCPLVVIIPIVLFPPTTPFTDQVTAELNVPVPWTWAVNGWLSPGTSEVLVGLTLTEVICGGGGGGG